MARHISYKYKGEWKKIPFSYDKYADSFEAVARSRRHRLNCISQDGAASGDDR